MSPGRNTTQGVVIQPNGERYEIDNLELDTLQEEVGGYIETVRLGPPGCVGIINEDGKRMDLPVNRIATAIATGLRSGDLVVGPMVVVGAPEDGELTPIPVDIAEFILEGIPG